MPPGPDTTAAPPAAGDAGLTRQLGLLSAIALVIGSTIGSGIFRVPARLAADVPSALPMLGVWVVGGVLVLCGALTYAELGGMFPRSGGLFVWLKEGFGPAPAFLYGWSELVVIRASSLGAISTVFAEYLLRIQGITQPADTHAMTVHLVAAGAIALMATLNYVGLRWASVAVNLTTAVKYGALVILVLGAFLLGEGSAAHFVERAGPVAMGPIGLSLIAVLWAYDGFSDLARAGGEIKNPARNLPRALVLGTLSIVVVYLAANLAYLWLIPVGEMPGSTLVAADAAQRLVGRTGVGLVSVVVMVSTLGAVASVMLTSPRIFFAMAGEGLFFRGLAQAHPRYRTPARAIVLTAAMAVTFVLFLDFERLSDTFVLATWPFYALSAAAVFVLRARRPDLERPVRTWGYPVVPALFILVGLAMLGNALRADVAAHGVSLALVYRGQTGLAFLLVLSGIPAYWLWRRFGARKAAAL